MIKFEIIPYHTSLKESVKELNYEWLQSYFRLEEGDILSLSDPDKFIIEPGGYIFFAQTDKGIVGTVSLLFKDVDIYELGKMAVKSEFRGQGIGEQLLKYCIDFAKSHKWKRLILYSNTKLEPAIYLYTKYGFVEVDLETGLYERANIKMQLDLID